MAKRMNRLTGIGGLSLALAGGMMACSKPASPSADLTRDLDAASSNSPALTLAPSSGRRDIVSSVEQSPDARRTQAASRVHLVTQPTSIVPPPAASIPQPVTPTATVAAVPSAVTPATAQSAAQSAAQPSPSKRPSQMQPAQTGRYKTEAEVFRNAPFPINP